ncbi:hypothetical protein FQN54_006615 [Arachnomyces sp. PD_36]|nr:hypothetical protein FQN54_006615 [Arachnomyces sp. PD_36]
MPYQTNAQRIDTSAKDSYSADWCDPGSSKALHYQGDCAKGSSTRSKHHTEGPEKQDHPQQTGYGYNQVGNTVLESKHSDHRNSAGSENEETWEGFSFKGTAEALGAEWRFESNPTVGNWVSNGEGGYSNKIGREGIFPVCLGKAGQALSPAWVMQGALSVGHTFSNQSTVGDCEIAIFWNSSPYMFRDTPNFSGRSSTHSDTGDSSPCQRAGNGHEHLTEDRANSSHRISSLENEELGISSDTQRKRPRSAHAISIAAGAAVLTVVLTIIIVIRLGKQHVAAARGAIAGGGIATLLSAAAFMHFAGHDSVLELIELMAVIVPTYATLATALEKML